MKTMMRAGSLVLALCLGGIFWERHRPADPRWLTWGSEQNTG